MLVATYLRFRKTTPRPLWLPPSDRIDVFYSDTEGKFVARDAAGNAVKFDSDSSLSLGTGVQVALGISIGAVGGLPVYNGSLIIEGSGFQANVSADRYTRLTSNSVIFKQDASFAGALIYTTLTNNRAWAFPDASGTFAFVSGDLGTPSSVTLTNAMGLTLAGIVAAAKSEGGTLTDAGKLAIFKSNGNLQSTGFNVLNPLDANQQAVYALDGLFWVTGATTSLSLSAGSPTANRSIAFPDASGTLALVGASARVPYTYVVASDVTNATTSMANVTGLAFPVLAGKKYSVVIYLATAKNDANGIRLQFTGPAAPTMVDGSAAGTTVDDNTFVTLSFLAFSSETATFNTVSGNGRVRSGTMLVNNGVNAGTVQLQFRSVTGGTSTIRAGSWIQVTQLD